MSTSTAAIAIVAPPTRFVALTDALASRWKVEAIDTTVLRLDEKKSTIGIAEVKEWLRQLYRTPRGRWRLAVIWDAERLTDAANNALLKTLEEPPAHTRLVLLLTRDTLLSTIRSRVQLRYDVADPNLETLVAVVPNTVSDIINTADEVIKKRTLPSFTVNLLAAVRSDLRSGRITASAADSISRSINRFSPGMSGKLMVESVLLTYREGRHDS